MSRSMGQSGRYPYDNNMDGVKKWNDKLSKGGKRTTDSRADILRQIQDQIVHVSMYQDT